MDPTVFIAGDVVLRGRSLPLSASLWGEMRSEIAADCCVANLEAPLAVADDLPIVKAGPVIGHCAEAIDCIKGAGFNLVTLANNHFRDYGRVGVETTLEALRAAGLDYVGGGATQEEAAQTRFLSLRGKRIALINACEHEYSVATARRGGSHALDPVAMYDLITVAKRQADHVVVIIHGGIEHYAYPTPRMKHWYRHFVEWGASAVVNHHQHCPAGYELWQGKPIFYGLGNFHFDRFAPTTALSSWNYGYAVRLRLGEDVAFELVPYVQCGPEGATMRRRDRKEFEEEMARLNAVIADDQQLNAQLNSFARSRRDELSRAMFPWKNRIVDGLLRRGLLPMPYRDRSVLEMKNLFVCESHREVITRLLEADVRRWGG